MSLFTRSTKRNGTGPEAADGQGGPVAGRKNAVAAQDAAAPDVVESAATEPDTATPDVAGADQDGSGPRGARLVFTLGVVAVMAMFLDGAWQRRWIADDGLIVLRTVRNLLASNGPVFNIDERVETNTSAAWTYLVYAFSWLTQVRLEYVVLTLALTLSLFAVALAMAGTARLYFAGSNARRTTGYLLPAGVLIYIALPPARDYATSGLESSLVIFWIGLVWLLLVWWATAERPGVAFTLGIAFVIGLAPMIRPEMVLVGLPCLAVLFVAKQPRRWFRPWLVAVAGAVPVAYQIWRMGYYALPYPNTAVAKDAGGAKWAQGMRYLENFADPYWLWLALALAAAGGVAAYLVFREPSAGALAGLSVRDRWAQLGWRERWTWLQVGLRTPRTVIVLVLLCGLLLAVYSLRVGGDFMHGRVLLPATFTLLLPVSVLPVTVAVRRTSGVREWAGAAIGLVWVAIAVYAGMIASRAGSAAGTTIGPSGIVDERAYYVLNTGHTHPILAEDYLDYPRMRAMLAAISDTPNGGLLLNSPSFMFWDVVPPPLPYKHTGDGHTVYFLNLGMTSMNLPLDIPVLDPEGLAYPLAAHSDRLPNGRIGHDKSLYPDWVIADLGMVDKHPWLPAYLDQDWVQQAKVALTCPATRQLLDSYRGPITWARFKQNFKHAIELGNYRIDRVPKYEIERCHLQMPPKIGR